MLYGQKLITPGKQCEILAYPEQSYRNICSISVKYSKCGSKGEVIFLIIMIWNNLNVVSWSNYGKTLKQASTSQPRYPKFEVATEFHVRETLESIFFPAMLG